MTTFDRYTEEFPERFSITENPADCPFLLRCGHFYPDEVSRDHDVDFCCEQAADRLAEEELRRKARVR
jgi:hypothetical protein